MTPRDSIGPASVRSDAYYLLSELIERTELDELVEDKVQVGALLGIALADLEREGWTILAPPKKVDVRLGVSRCPETTRTYDEPFVSLAEAKCRARWAW